MKQLLLALLAALALPTNVISGDLGAADLPTIEEAYSSSEKYQKKKSESISNEFNLACQPGKIYLQGMRDVACKVVFKNGLLTVDNSKGIKPSQVLSILGMEELDYRAVTISYIDSNNKYSIASFYSRGNVGNFRVMMFPFYIRLLEWKNTGK